MFNKTHIGQQVSDPYFGNGVIVAFNQGLNFPVTVNFDTGNKTYALDGRLLGEYLPTLQFGPMDNWERRTQPQVQDGQIIEVLYEKCSNPVWRLSRVHIKDNVTYFSPSIQQNGEPVLYELNHTWRCAL